MTNRLAPPPDAAELIRAYAADGFSVRGVAMKLGVSYDPVFLRWMEDYPELREAMARGREEERHALHNVLYRLATEQKDKVAAMFLLKARHAYRDDGRDEQAGNRVSINFTIPAALPLTDFVTINHGDSGTPAKPLPAKAAGRSRRT